MTINSSNQAIIQRYAYWKVDYDKFLTISSIDNKWPCSECFLRSQDYFFHSKNSPGSSKKSQALSTSDYATEPDTLAVFFCNTSSVFLWKLPVGTHFSVFFCFRHSPLWIFSIETAYCWFFFILHHILRICATTYSDYLQFWIPSWMVTICVGVDYLFTGHVFPWWDCGYFSLHCCRFHAWKSRWCNARIKKVTWMRMLLRCGCHSSTRRPKMNTTAWAWMSPGKRDISVSFRRKFMKSSFVWWYF